MALTSVSCDKNSHECAFQVGTLLRTLLAPPPQTNSCGGPPLQAAEPELPLKRSTSCNLQPSAPHQAPRSAVQLHRVTECARADCMCAPRSDSYTTCAHTHTQDKADDHAAVAAIWSRMDQLLHAEQHDLDVFVR
jgi:hypothetical protein